MNAIMHVMYARIKAIADRWHRDRDFPISRGMTQVTCIDTAKDSDKVSSACSALLLSLSTPFSWEGSPMVHKSRALLNSNRSLFHDFQPDYHSSALDLCT